MTVRTIVLSVCFLVASTFIAVASKSVAIPVRQPLKDVPLQVGKWQGQEAGELTSQVVALLGVTDYLNRVYSSDSRRIELYVGFHESQKSGSAIHSPMNCLPGAGWNPVDRRQIAIPIASMPDIVVNRVLIEKGSEKLLVLYWYQSHGRVVASEYWGKAYTVLDSIRIHRTDSALVRVITEGAGQSESEIVDFVQKMFPHLSSHLPD